MTLITLNGGKVVMRDNKVGTSQDCCCGPFCNHLCGLRSLSIEVARNGGAGTFAFPFEYEAGTGENAAYIAPGGNVYFQSNTVFTFANVYAVAECGYIDTTIFGLPFPTWGASPYWKVTLTVTGCDNYSLNPFNCDAIDETWVAFIPYDGNGCPDFGDVTFQCQSGCDGNTTVTGSVVET